MKDDPLLVCQLFRTFSPNFWVVKECLILELLEMIRVLLHVVACPMDFNLFCDRRKQAGGL